MEIKFMLFVYHIVNGLTEAIHGQMGHILNKLSGSQIVAKTLNNR